MPEFADHPVFGPLSLPLSAWLCAWIDQALTVVGRDADEVYEILMLAVQDGGAPLQGLSPAERGQVGHWFTRAPVRQLVLAIADRRLLLKKIAEGSVVLTPIEQTPPPLAGGLPHKPATPEQLRIIREIQREARIDLSRFFGQLTAWEADVVIKGCGVVSEVTRQTGDRHFPLGSVRHAVRAYLKRGSLSGAVAPGTGPS